MKNEKFELTNPQKSIWLTNQMYPNIPIENICGTIFIEERVDFTALENAINIFVEKNDSFRIKLTYEENEVKQYISDFTSFKVEKITLENEEELNNIEKELGSKIFPTFESLLFEFKMFEFPDGKGGFAISLHHLIGDAWTGGIGASEILDIYAQLINKKEKEEINYPSYIDYIDSERKYLISDRFKKDKEYWDNIFSKEFEIAKVPSIKGKITNNVECIANRKVFNISKEVVDEINKFCTEKKISIFNFFMAIYAIYLGKVSNLQEFVIGTPILNRSTFKEKHTTGMFISTAPFKICLKDNCNFDYFVSEIAKDTLSMLRHQKYPYHYILEDLRKTYKSIPNLYDVLISYQNIRSDSKISTIPFNIKWNSNGYLSDGMNIHLYDMNDTGSLDVAYDYLISKYDELDIENIHTRIIYMINQVLENSDIMLNNIEIVTSEENKTIVENFNNTNFEYDKSKTIVNLFEEQVEKTPNAVALVFGDQKLTYKELNEKANSLAHYLRNEKIGRNDIVGIMVNRSLEMIISILAVLKSGACYIPIDPEYPQDRIEYMLENSNAKMLLTFEKLQNKLKFSNKLFVELTNELYNSNKDNIENINEPDDLAYIIYTSGSTGKPKGVMLVHKSLSNLTNYCNNYVQYLKDSVYRTIVSVTTVSFDIFLFETLISLQKGLKLVIANEEEQTIPRLLNDLIEKNNIEIIQTTPSRMQLLVNNIKDIPSISKLKFITLAGEQLPTSLVNELKNICKPVIYNGYGPSETTVFSTLTDITDHEFITIGKPLNNTQIYILNSGLNICPIGIPGEIYIAGDGVGKGYINNEELTKKNYLTNRFSSANKIMYKTGDLGYYNPNGEIVCLGRCDNQVKIRGLRIELEEIENEILKNESVRNCVVVKKVSDEGHEFLCAYFMSDEEVNIDSIRAKLQKALPQYMVPQYFVELEEFPYTPNGKIDRKKLPMPKIDLRNKEIVLPRNNTDEILVKQLKEILNTNAISIEDSFFELGGDSLAAINFCTKIYSELNVQIFVRDIIDNPIVKDLSDLISSKDKVKDVKIQKAGKREFYPVSTAQRRTYYVSNIAGEDSILYNISGGLILDKIPDISKLENAFNKLIQRQASLRTYFVLENEQVVQKIKDTVDFKLELGSDCINENDIQFAFDEFVRPFNLSNASLFRAKLIKMNDNKALLMIDMHHIISDGTSLSILVNELCGIYNNEEMPELKIDYKDYSIWENSKLKNGDLEESEQYWVNQFKGEIPVLNLPTKARPEIQSFEGNKVYAKINSNKINELAKRQEITPYMLLLSAYYILLSKYTSVEDIIVGTPIVNRNNSELYNIIGMFVNSLPLRMNIDVNLSVKEFINNVKDKCLQSYKYQEYPFDELVNKLNINHDAGRNPLFDTMFIYQNNGYTPVSFNGINAKYYIPKSNISKFDISLEIIPNDTEFTLSFEYATKLFDEDFIKNLSNHYINIVNAIIDNNDIKIADICMLSEDEKNKILYDFNNTKTDYPKDKTIIELFEEQVSKKPNDIAVVFENKKLTYKELNSKAEAVAHCLYENGIRTEDSVAIFLDKSLEMIIAILGILKVGAVYVPIDVDYPDSRIDFMLKDSNAKTVITKNEFNLKLDFENKLLIDLDNDIYSKNYNTLPNLKSDLAYIMYTSGSTGTPKGVMVKQQSIIRLVKNTNYIKFQEEERILQTGSIVFDACTFEIWSALLNGFELYIIKKSDLLDPISLRNYLEKNKITILWLTAPLLNQLCENNPDMFKTVRYLLTGGDVLSPKHINLIKENCPNLTIINGYGPTENTTFSTCFTIEDNYNSSIPIGYPISNSTCYIVSKDMSLLPIGVPGELIVGGDGVAKGYINNEDFTNSKFMNSSFNDDYIYKTGDLAKWNGKGYIEFIGRIDGQAKIRGFRVELSEINSKILEFTNVKNSFTTVKVINNEKFICSYIVCDADVNIEELKIFLKKYLPSYSIPTYFIKLDELPINTNGKVNASNLPDPKTVNNKDKILSPRNSIDEKLVLILKQLLNVNEISIDDSFFELGGDSLSAINLCSKIYSELNVQILVKDILEKPVISDLSDLIASRDIGEVLNYKVLKAEKSEFYPVSSEEKRMYYSTKKMSEENLLYNVSGALLADNILDTDKIKEAFLNLIKLHSSFRTRFIMKDDKLVQEVLNHEEVAKNLNIDVFSDSEKNIDKIIKKFPKPFDLASAPLLRIGICILDNEKTLILLDTHHIVMDGFSLNILIRDFCKLYNNEEIQEQEFTYIDYSVWENNYINSNEINECDKYWTSVFPNAEIPTLNLPYDYTNTSTNNFDGDKVSCTIEDETFKKLQDLAKAHKVSEYTLFITALYVLLYKYTSQTDLIVASPLANRSLKEFQNVIGMFVNNIVLRKNIDTSKSVSDFLEDVQNTVNGAIANQPYPYELISKKVNNNTSLLDVVLTYQNIKKDKYEIDNSSLELISADTKTSKFNIWLEIIPDTHIINLEYNSSLFKKQTIKSFIEHYMFILEQFISNNDTKIEDLDIITPKELKLLEKFNSTDGPINDDTVVSIFEEQVKKYPKNIALICEDKTLTYSELNKRANSLAHYLIKMGVKKNDIVCIMTNRSFETIVCMIAILKAGAAFFNVDPTYPTERTKYYLEESKTRYVLTQKELKSRVETIENCIEIDLSIEEIYGKNFTNPNVKIDAQDLSYLIYTSGSTGKPKGTMLNHVGLANMVKAMTRVLDYLKEGNKHCIASVTSTPFDIFVYEIIVSLTHGLKIAMANNAEHRNPKLLDALIKKCNVDVMTVTPSLMKINYDNREPDTALAQVKNMVFGGEPLPEKFVKDLKALADDITIYNIYGPSEITILSNVQNLDGETEITTGPPIMNTQIHILDKNMKRVPIGVVGEIYISGIQVGLGYIGKPELTRERFLDNPFGTGKMYKSGDIGRWTFDGKVQCLGRIDNQIKLRGLRIELGEIENLMLNIDGVSSAIVNKIEIDNKEFLCGYYVCDNDIQENLVKETLRKALPPYMVPTYIVKLKEMPYTINRKIDRKALPLPELNKPVVNSKVNIEELTSDEEKLLQIWKNILKIEDIDVNDNFFDIGGDSVSAISMQIEAVKYGLDFEYSDIFTYPTIKELSKRANRAGEEYIKTYDYSKFNEILNRNTVENLKSIKKAKINNILLIGSTGYFGAHILNEFMKTNKGIVYCLVRPKNSIDIEKRLQDTLSFYFGDKYKNEFSKRIRVIHGDITEDNIGLSDKDYETLVNDIDVVINSGALVKHYGIKKKFEEINVTGTKNVVEFCLKNKKRLMHVSTISVSGNGEKEESVVETLDNINDKKIFKEKDIYIEQNLKGVYSITKFKAELLVLEGISNGLDAQILRLGNIVNRYSDGVFQMNASENAFAKRIKSFIEIGAFPRYLSEHSIELTPVDLSANAVIKILNHTSSCNIFHIYNTKLLPVQLLMKTYLNDLNIEILPVSNIMMKDILTGMLADNERKEILSGIIYDLDDNKNLIYTSNIRLTAEFTEKYLHKIGFKWKKINRKYIIKYMNYLKKIKFI